MSGMVVDLQTGLPKFRDSVWCQFGGTISASSNLVIDTLPLAEFSNMKYELSFTGDTANDVRFLTLVVQKRNGNIKEVVYGKTGPMKMAVNTSINGASFELEVINPEIFDVEYCVTVLTS